MRKLWEWIKHPHGAALIAFYICTAIFIAGAIVFSVIGTNESYGFAAYIFYGLAAVTLGYTVYTLVLFVPKWKQGVIGVLKKNGFTEKLYEQYGFRTLIFAVFSLALSLGNAILNGTIGIVRLSLWYGALGAYYLLLSLMRGGVLLYHRKKKRYAERETETQIKVRELKKYRGCGILLVLLPLALSFAIWEMTVFGKGFVHAGLMIYVAAAYTFYKVTMSIVNFFKARKGDECTVRAIRNVNLADALVSVLALQTAMFHEFSPHADFGMANAITGTAVCALTVTIGVFMIVNGSLKIKKMQTEATDDAG